jgi:hypothetical protein
MRFNALAVLSTFALAATASPLWAQSFTYQGELRELGVVANGVYDVEFRVFEQLAGGDQIGTTSTATVTITDGRLVAIVDPGAGVFSGEDRWLGISVRPFGGGAFTPLANRQRISAVPYAIRSLNERWTPQAGGMLTSDGYNTSVGINASAPLVPGAMLSVLRNTSAAGESCGIIAATSRTDGLPYFGFLAGDDIGGRIAYDGQSRNLIIAGRSDNAAEVDFAGRIGIPNAPTGLERVQVTGAVSVTGDAKVGSLTYAAPKTRYLSIPPEAFHPQLTTQPGNMGQGQGEAYLDGSVTIGNLIAPVYLPDGAVVTEVRAHFFDQSFTADLSAELRSRVLFLRGSAEYTTMASITTNGWGSSVQTVIDSTIIQPIIDNSFLGYCISVGCTDWAGTSTAITGVRITYTVAEPD